MSYQEDSDPPGLFTGLTAALADTPTNRKLAEEAAVYGATLLGPGKNCNYRRYRLECGHEQEVQTSNMRRGAFQCRTCPPRADAKLAEEAADQGATLLGPGKDPNYRLYRLGCQHEQEVDTSKMRRGNFKCRTCTETQYYRPSTVYLLHIAAADGHCWLKLGKSKNAERRAKGYGLDDNSVVTIVCSAYFDTGVAAESYERAIHSKLRSKRLDPDKMRLYHWNSGGSECYPLDMHDDLVDLLVAVGGVLLNDTFVVDAAVERGPRDMSLLPATPEGLAAAISHARTFPVLNKVAFVRAVAAISVEGHGQLCLQDCRTVVAIVRPDIGKSTVQRQVIQYRTGVSPAPAGVPTDVPNQPSNPAPAPNHACSPCTHPHSNE